MAGESQPLAVNVVAEGDPFPQWATLTAVEGVASAGGDELGALVSWEFYDEPLAYEHREDVPDDAKARR